MTPEEFTARLPRFTEDDGLVPAKPPFHFNGLSARVFPLRASLDALQQLCNSYVNIGPPEVGRFRAVLPYVYLALLDYAGISESADSRGWFAQTEVYFGVPIEWYKVVRGRWVFHDWALLTPYIFVDDDFSVPLGRTVYGFPKTLARMTPAASRWLNDPMSAVTVARVETGVFPELYKGRRMESRVLLEVTRDAPASNVRLPADPQHPMAPWVVASNLAQAFAGLGRDAMWLAQSMRISPVHPGANPDFVSAMLERWVPAFAPSGPGFILNSLNLKQFPRSDDPKFICYQALTNGPMHVTAVNGAGLIGEECSFLGDLSGGYRIQLHQYSSLPIARILGLEIDRRWRGDGVDVAALTPVMPFWVNLNVKYEQGVNLAWRTRTGIWRRGNGDPLDPPQAPNTNGDGPRINTTTASSVDNITGPFRFTGTTIRVLPLLACRDKLQEFLEKRINAALSDSAAHGRRRGKPIFRLSLWARELHKTPYGYVYLAVSSLGEVTSGTNNVGDWAQYELSFLIPVKWEQQNTKDGPWRLNAVGLFPAYSFVDNTVAAVSRSEVLGIPTTRATFVNPESVWLKEGAANLVDKQPLLRMDAEVFPAMGVGQQTAMHTVVEVTARDSDAGIGDPLSLATPGEWAAILKSELEAKKAAQSGEKGKLQCRTARALALELLGNQTAVSLFALKQFRDVADLGKACYQSLVRVSRTLEEVVDLREMEETLRVRIHDFPTLSPIKSLGIVAKPLREEGSGIIYGTQAIRPFYIRATLGELGRRLLSRTGTLEWKVGAEALSSLLSNKGPMITVDRMAAHMQDHGDPSHPALVARRSEKRRQRELRQEKALAETPAAAQKTKKLSAREKEERNAQLEEADLQRRITKREAAADLAIVDPQMVIESILSREWGNADQNARWRRGREDLRKVRETMLAGGAIQLAAFTLPKNNTVRSEGQIRSTYTLPDQVGRGQLRRTLWQGRQNFATLEQALYLDVCQDKVNRPGRPPLVRPEITRMIDRMREFTMGRLEIECHFNTLAAFSFLEATGRPAADEPLATEEKAYATRELIRNLDLISKTPVVPEEYLDPRALDRKCRLCDLVGVLKKELGQWFVAKSSFDDAPEDPIVQSEDLISQWGSCNTTMANNVRKYIDRRFEQQAGDDFQQLTGVLREAVQLATQYCNVQQDALVDKLSRGYQKPDFCIRRDALGRERDRLLPLAQSWDEDWYFGKKPLDEGPAGKQVAPKGRHPQGAKKH